MTRLNWLLVLALANIPCGAYADSDIDAIKSKLQSLSSGFKIKSVTPSAIPGIYEVFANGSIYYVDKSAKYLMADARLIETESKRNLTAERLKVLTAVKFESLPFKNAFEIKQGTGAYHFAVFSDPDCPFCKNLEVGMNKLGVTNYTASIFLFPLQELHPDARWKAEAIWCASDPSTTWRSWMLDGKVPEKKTCDNPIDANIKLANELGVYGTPTIYLNDGTQTSDPQQLVDAIRK